jgi:general secretion pathway protein D
LAPPAPTPPFAGPGEEPRMLFQNESSDGGEAPALEPIVERGSGRLVGRSGLGSSGAPGLLTTDAGEISLNVVDADIREVVRLVLEDGLNANYVIDPAVSGTITVRTSRPLAASDMLSTLDSVLNLNGAALIEQSGVYKVVPLEQVLRGGIKPEVRPVAEASGRGFGIQVVPLRYTQAVELAELLKPFVPDETSVQVNQSRNTLLLVGSAAQQATLTELVDIFDVDWMSGMSYGLYPLDSVSALTLADELDQIFADPGAEALPGAVRFVPIERLNALLVITAQPDYLARAETWIQRLDRAGEGDGEQVYVYAVQNGRAADLAEVLGEIFDVRSSAIGADPASLAPGLEPVELRSSISDAAATPDLPEGEEGGLRAELGGGRPNPFEERLGGVGGRQDLTRGDDRTGTRIVADRTNNSLLIRATPKEYKKILSAIRELDTQPLQVLLEATIAEVTLRDELSYGIQWFFDSGDVDVTLSEFPNGVVGQIFPGFSGLLASNDVRAVINALDSVSDVNVISSPQLLVLDNQTAQLEVGDEVPIVTQQSTGIDVGDSRIVNTVEQRQTGVILNVTPRVNASGLVVLDIQQEVSDVVRTTTSGIDSPTIAQRRIGTSVAVGTNQTVALGGLIQEDVEEIKSGVPFFSDLPVIGVLFGATTQSSTRTELLVLITPKVITNQQEAQAATNDLRRRIRAVETLAPKIQPIDYGPAPLAPARRAGDPAPIDLLREVPEPDAR